MLNIFANALLIAAQLGRIPDAPKHGPRVFDDVEGLRTANMLRGMGR